MTVDKQGSLFDLQDIVSIDGRGHTIDGAFKLFHAANPHVYRLLKQLALEMRASGRERYGIGGLFERLRWEYAIKTSGEFKLNNNYRALYARKLMAEERELAGFFQTRTRKAVGAEKEEAQQPTLTVTALAYGEKETPQATVYIANTDEVGDGKKRALAKVHREWRKVFGTSHEYWPSHVEFWLGDLAGGMDFIETIHTYSANSPHFETWGRLNTAASMYGANR